jgi:WD40 repeat protein
VQAHEACADVVVGTEDGLCVLHDARTGQEVWCLDCKCEVTSVALVPAPDVRSVVTGHADGTLRLLDLRRQGPVAELARAKGSSAVTALATDGCCTLAGLESGQLLIWTLDPATEQTREDRVRGITCSGAGLAFEQALAGGGSGAVAGLAVGTGADGAWCFAVGHSGSTLDVCVLQQSE